MDTTEPFPVIRENREACNYVVWVVECVSVLAPRLCRVAKTEYSTLQGDVTTHYTI